MKKIILSTLALAVALGGSWVALDRVAAQSAQAAPQLQFLMTDQGGGNPSLPGQCNGNSQTFGWAALVRDTVDNDNSDCAKVRITNPADRYTQDFRFCFDIGERVSCTPWASQGGGGTGRLASTGDWAIGYMNVWTETRSLGGNGYLENVRAGIQWFELPDRGSCGASGGLKWANGSGGSAESDWTYGGSNDNDPGCAELQLTATYVAPYDASFAGSNLSGAQLLASTTYGAASNYRITMRNEGHAWTSSSIVRQDGDCDDFEAGEDVDPCSYTKTVTSPNVKLERLAGDAELFGFPERMSYEQQVTVTHESIAYTGCAEHSAADYRPSMLARLSSFLVPTAHAMRAPDEPIEPNDPPCTPVTRYYERVTEMPSGGVVLPPATVTVPATFVAPAPGAYTLRFQMVKTDGATAGTDPQGRFGDIAEVPVTVIADPGTARMTMSCPVAQLNARPGDTASYLVSILSQGGFTGTANVAVSGLPAGATSPGASIQVPPNASASGLVPVSIASTTPNGTSTLTFTASASGVQPTTCTSLLVIDGGTAGTSATLTIRPGSRTLGIGEQTTFDSYYDPDGTGPQPERRVTSDTTWGIANASVARNDGGGRYTGLSGGTTQVRASYASGSGATSLLAETAHAATVNATAGLTVDAGGAATFEVRPASTTVMVGSSTGYEAFHDPDGSGPQEERDVTGLTTWSVTGSAGSHLGNGVFRGVSVGSGTVTGDYDGLSDDARLNVIDTPPTTGTCGFMASPASLFVPPRRSTTLSWNCTVPTTCTVTVADTPRAGTQVASGGQQGSGTDQPAFSTTYRLNCADGTREEARVRVFDVTTRVEILPR